MSDTAWLIVDGYNLMLSSGLVPDGKPRDLESRRHHLIGMLERALGQMADRITLVFDGRLAPREPALENAAIEVLFSSGGQTADTVIERLVAEAERPDRIVVVTSDGAECRTVNASGAQSMSCGIFLDRLKAHDETLNRTMRNRSGRISFPLGTLIPALGTGTSAPPRKGTGHDTPGTAGA